MAGLDYMCATEWSLDLADQILCVGVYEGSIYICIHAYGIILNACVYTCVHVHVHVGKITGWYILLCHHLRIGKKQTTSYTLTHHKAT